MVHSVDSLFRVRSYEADSYRHLNNGVYVGWCEQGRLDYLESLGYSYDGFADRAQWFVVRRTEVDFLAPLHVGDEVVLTSRVEAVGRTSVRFAQTMRRRGEEDAVCEARTVMVFSGETGRPIPVPDDVRAAIGEPAGG